MKTATVATEPSWCTDHDVDQTGDVRHASPIWSVAYIDESGFPASISAYLCRWDDESGRVVEPTTVSVVTGPHGEGFDLAPARGRALSELLATVADHIERVSTAVDTLEGRIL